VCGVWRHVVCRMAALFADAYSQLREAFLRSRWKLVLDLIEVTNTRKDVEQPKRFGRTSSERNVFCATRNVHDLIGVHHTWRFVVDVHLCNPREDEVGLSLGGEDVRERGGERRQEFQRFP